MRRAVVLAALLGGARIAAAQSVDVPALVKLCETQPAGTDKSAWAEQRRDAARKLAGSRDRRAVPELQKLAATEAYDIIGDIAIEGLGNIGDASAVPTLQKIANDAAREKSQRDLAVKALKKLGATPTSPVAGGTTPITSTPPGATTATASATTGGGATTATGGGATGGGATTATGGGAGAAASATSGGDATPSDADALRPAADASTTAPTTGSALLGDRPAPPPLPNAPQIDDDVLAASERIQFAGGTANAGYDSIRKRLDFDANLAGSYAKRVEHEQWAWGWDASAHLVGGYINPSGSEFTRGGQATANGDAEARFYKAGAYVIGRAAVALQGIYVADTDGADNSNSDKRFTADVQVALGVGYGRMLDIGAAIRVRRLAAALQHAHALGKPIDAATSKRLQLAWWSLRGSRSTWDALVQTVAILREAGVLLGEPDAGTSYEILNVLRDTQLYARPSGLDVNVQFGEGYLRRPDDPMPQEAGRVESLLANAGYAMQLADDTLELAANAYARYRLFAPMDQPSPWAAGVTGSLRRFVYGEHGDPFGALDATLTLAASDDDLMNVHADASITATVGYTFFFNQASGIRIGGNLTEDRGDVIFGLSLSGTYGLLDGTFAR